MASFFSTIVLFLHLVPVVVLTSPQTCSVPSSCDRDTPCATLPQGHNYKGTSGDLNEVTISAAAYRYNSTHMMLQWDNSSVFPGMWGRYVVQWNFCNDCKMKCMMLPKSETTLFVAKEKSGLGADIEVQVDIYPLPKNWGNFGPRLLFLKQGPTTASGLVTSSSTSVDTKTKTPANTTASGLTTGSGLVTSSSTSVDKKTKTLAKVNTTTSGTTVSSYVVNSSTGDAAGNEQHPLWVWAILALSLVALLAVVAILRVYWSSWHKSALEGQEGASSEWLKRNSTEAALIAQPLECQERSYVVSYWPESDKYIEKIVSVVAWFRQSAGYAMIMDKMATTEICSKGHVRWAESEIHKADKVLVFLSPGYINTYMKDDFHHCMTTDEEKRVWYEMQILKGIYSSTRSANKIVCVLTDDKTDTSVLPPWAVVTYRWPKDKDKIIMRLNELPEIPQGQVTGKFDASNFV